MRDDFGITNIQSFKVALTCEDVEKYDLGGLLIALALFFRYPMKTLQLNKWCLIDIDLKGKWLRDATGAFSIFICFL